MRPVETVQPVQWKQSRREIRSSKAFVLAYTGTVIALQLPQLTFETFPDKYCLKHGTNNWYYVHRQPSLRAARRIVMLALENPGWVITVLPYTIWELSTNIPKYFVMMMMASGERSSFAKRGITCCGAARYHSDSILEAYSHAMSSGITRTDLDNWSNSRSPLSYGAELFNRIRASSRQIKSVTKTLKKSNENNSRLGYRDVLRSPTLSRQ